MARRIVHSRGRPIIVLVIYDFYRWHSSNIFGPSLMHPMASVIGMNFFSGLQSHVVLLSVTRAGAKGHVSYMSHEVTPRNSKG